MKWDSELYNQKHAFVFKYGEDLLALLDARPGERILDVGCGAGQLTAMIAASGADVTGMDSSPEMIATARAAYPEISFVIADASDFSFAEAAKVYDAIFSNAALHWVERAEDAIVCMSKALKPGGRFVVEFGGKGNIANIASALEQAIREVRQIEINAMNYFPSIGEYTPLLERHGIEVASAVLFDRPTKLEGGEDGMENWIRMFRGPRLTVLNDDEQREVMTRVKHQLRDTQFKDGDWYADYRRLRITGCKRWQAKKTTN